MEKSKVRIEFRMGERLGWSHPEPMSIEEFIEEGETLRSLLNRLVGRISHFQEAVFNPQTQSLSSEVAIVINEHIQNLVQGLETKLQDGDRLLFLPILAGG
ncbi:MAG: MoaD/ThiS family protein [Deltaproteobacteria bacterium]|nr:MoaD/ThiS family protein [Deltaproteobacteria bacterium]